MRRLFRTFEEHGAELFLVGGCVRDICLGVQPKDRDFATSVHPGKTIELLKFMGLPAIPIGIEFGTVQTILDGEKVEITTFRCKESYIKGSRKPAVVFGTSIEEDLARRDFTFNAMAQDSEGRIIDPFNGRMDLDRGILRTPINPEESFSDDPLRMLRACRFIARQFIRKVDPETHQAICKLSGSLMDSVSVERVAEEIGKLLLSDDAPAGLRMLAETGLLKSALPELVPVLEDERPQGKWHHLTIWEHTLEVVRLSNSDLECRWAALFHDVAKPMCRTESSTGVHFFKHDVFGQKIWDEAARRLKMSNDFREHIGTLIFEHQNLRRCKKVKAIRRIMHRVGDGIRNLGALSRADIKAHAPHTVDPSLDELAHAWSIVRQIQEAGGVSDALPKGTGDKVAAELGLKAGPELGKIINGLKSKMVDGLLLPDASDSDILKLARTVQKELGQSKK